VRQWEFWRPTAIVMPRLTKRLAIRGFDNWSHQLVTIRVGMQAIGGQAVFWPATLVDEDGELSGVRSRRDGRRILHPSIQIQNVGRGRFSVLDRQDLVLDKSSKRIHDREHRRNEAGIRRRSPHSASFRLIPPYCCRLSAR